MSLSTFYEHFADKEQCFLAAYDRVADQVFAVTEDSIRHAATPREALDAGIAAYFGWGADHPSAAVTFVVEVHTAGPAALDRRAAIIDRFRQLLAQAPRAAGLRRKRAVQLPAAAVDAVAYTLDSMAHELIRQGRAREQRAAIPAAQELARHILRL